MKIEGELLRIGAKLIDAVKVQPALTTSSFVQLKSRSGRMEMRLSGVSHAAAFFKCREKLAPLHLDRRNFMTFLSKSGKQIELTQKGREVLLRSGRARLKFALPDKVDGSYLEAPTKKGVKTSLDTALLKMLSNYAEPLPGDEYFEAVQCVKGFGAFATDSFVIAGMLTKKMSQSGTIPRRAAELCGNGTLFMSTEGATVENEAGWTYHPLPANMKEYPIKDFQSLLLKAAKQLANIRIQQEQLVSALQYLDSLVKGQEVRVNFAVAGKNNTNLMLKATDEAAVAEYILPYHGKCKEGFALLLRKLLPWISFVGEGEIGFLISGGNVVLKAKREAATYLLACSEISE